MTRFPLFLTLSILSLYLLCPCNAKKPVRFYELSKGDDFTVTFTNWGATIMNVILPDARGNLDDVVLGYSDIASYVNDTSYFGAVVGRVANRIGGAKFYLDGVKYKVYPNEGNNSLHGGHRGFSHVIWTVQRIFQGEKPSITFFYRSFDGEQGFPGDVQVWVTYRLIGHYQIAVDMQAKALNRATPVNLAQHTYWNLAGHSSGDILSHTIQIFASKITPVDDALIPTGELAPVDGTAYDFRKPNTIGSRIDELPSGYDTNYVLDYPKNCKGIRKAAVLKDSKSGRKMELYTDQPGMQFYTSGKPFSVPGKGGYNYQLHAGVALETQGFPDAVNHPNFPSQILRPGHVYRHKMHFKFSFECD